MSETIEHEYRTHKRDKPEITCIYVILFITLYFLSLKDASFEYIDMLPIVYVGDISIALSTVVLTISMAIAAVLAVFIHESIHYFGYRLSGSEPEFKRSGFNPYVTNFDHAITLWNKLWIDALPTIVGIVFILIFVLINQFYTIPVVLNYSIATVLIWLVALARMDWRNIYQLDNKVENTKEYTIIHRKKAQNEYPIGIIEKR